MFNTQDSTSVSKTMIITPVFTLLLCFCRLYYLNNLYLIIKLVESKMICDFLILCIFFISFILYLWSNHIQNTNKFSANKYLVKKYKIKKFLGNKKNNRRD